ncbi:MAG: DUF92 domain-containing protein [Gemmatimonadota bacterium]
MRGSAMWLAVGAPLLAVASLLAARTYRWLTPAGMLAGTIVGGAVFLGTGPAGLLLVLLFFGTTSALTTAVAPREGRTAIGGRGGVRGESHASEAGWRKGRQAAEGRSAAQVIANGGVAAACAALAMAGAGAPGPAYGVAGSLAAAMADSWATEVGTAVGAPTWLINTGRRVAPGRSGGVSIPGTAAGLLGAAILAATAAALSRFGLFSAPEFMPTVLAGVGGMTIDSALGASLEGRIRGATNEFINLAATAAGAAIAWVVAAAWGA